MGRRLRHSTDTPRLTEHSSAEKGDARPPPLESPTSCLLQGLIWDTKHHLAATCCLFRLLLTV